MNRASLLCVLVLAACSPQSGDKVGENAGRTGQGAVSAPAAEPIKPAPTAAPAGVYALDLTHTSLTFKVDHVGLSRYTARFTKLDGKLKFDPADPTASSVVVNIDPGSLRTDNPETSYDFDAQISGPEFLDAGKFPRLTFRSTKVEMTGPSSARVTGDLTFHGVTRPVVLETTFNGGYPLGAMDPKAARIGFSAHGSLKRSEFGVGYGLPPPGTKMGVGDDVEILIETEFTQP